MIFGINFLIPRIKKVFFIQLVIAVESMILYVVFRGSPILSTSSLVLGVG